MLKMNLNNFFFQFLKNQNFVLFLFRTRIGNYFERITLIKNVHIFLRSELAFIFYRYFKFLAMTFTGKSTLKFQIKILLVR